MSGIYIKDMAFPKDREIRLRIDEKGEVYVYDTYPQELYVAISVPDHGRLIDADAFEALIHGLGNREYRREHGTICDAIKMLQPHYAPTIIPADKGAEP